ncbi:hypothetical protein SAMN05660420_03191 [Desulfuromusa kysingii]|uniref:Uncharacterized protein n=1 Tax=Desulfuromusa kysingii TaxID=37625 RepID=A0A1H4E3P7_9BACT|nr:hypothetical protein SAMN05660420_03191 [Desulfuromusa kysingii]
MLNGHNKPVKNIPVIPIFWGQLKGAFVACCSIVMPEVFVDLRSRPCHLSSQVIPQRLPHFVSSKEAVLPLPASAVFGKVN